DRGLDRRVDRGPVAGVGAAERGPLPEFADELLPRRLVEVRDDHPGPLRDEQLGGRPADAVRATRDERHLAVQLTEHPQPPIGVKRRWSCARPRSMYVGTYR